MFRVALISLFLTSASLADTWTVDDDGKADFDNIQAAIDAASDGDTVEVQAGTYYETIDFLGKSISLIGVSGSGVTIINAEFSGTAVTINNTKSATTVQGLTIKKGVTEFGAGLYLSNCIDLRFIDCDIRANIANTGGGVYADSCTMTFQDSFIRNNQTNGGNNYGGGLYLNSCTVDMVDTVISGNEGDYGAGAYALSSPLSMNGGGIIANLAVYGGGLYLNGSDTTIWNTQVSDNYGAEDAGAFFCNDGVRIDLVECYGSNNTSSCNGTSSYGGTIYLKSGAIATIHECNFRNGCAGSGGFMYVSSLCIVDISNTILGSFNSVFHSDTIYISGTSPIVYILGTVICNANTPIEGGWFDKGGNSFPSECPEFLDTGSCCLNGVCTPMTSDNCNSIYGIFLGVGSDCADSQCPTLSEPTGACCLDMGQCVATLENDCLAASGNFAGQGVICDDSACPEHCYGDIDGDGTVNIVDVLGVMASWGACP